LHELQHDVRFALRTLARNPGFTAIALLTLALGIGANSLVFSVIESVLLRRLPYADAGALVSVSGRVLDTGAGPIAVSFTKFAQLEGASTLGAAAAIFPFDSSISGDGEPEPLPVARVSLHFLDVLGVTPAHGRWFLPEEDREGGREVAVISDGLWHRRFGGDPGLLGRSVLLDGKPATIVGILPPSFRFPLQEPEPAAWLPRVFDVSVLKPEQVRSGAGYLAVIGRLRAGATLPAVEAELGALSARYATAFPGYVDASGQGLQVSSLQDSLVGQVRPSLLALLAAVGFVLLIACANVASLLLARASSRSKEFAIRLALGAPRRRLFRQLLTESVTLASLGGVLGLALAAAGLPLLRAMDPNTLPRAGEIRIDSAVLLFSLGCCVLAGIAFGLAPALQLSRTDVQDRLKEGGRGPAAAAGHGPLRQLVVAEVAVALVLVTGAGLLLATFRNLLAVDPGFDARDVTTLPINLPTARYPEPERQAAFYRQLVERAGSLPGVASAAVASYLPLSGSLRFVFFCPDGFACQGLGRDPTIAVRQVSPDFFRTLRIPLRHGRYLSEADAASSPRVVVINETTARRYFPAGDAVGRHLANSRDRVPLEIVGVVGDLKFSALSAPEREEMYLPEAQAPWPAMSLVVRSSGEPAPLAAALRAKVRELDADLAVGPARGLEDVVAASVAQPRLTAQLVLGFALLALAMAVVGVYGVMAYLVSQRSHELQIRMALGARREDIFRLVMGQGLRLVLAGVAVGTALSLAFGRLLESLLFRTAPTDLATHLGAALLLVAAALLACGVPAWRAARASAVLALR
jgi:putative ABC transport system permease protein